MEPRLYLYLHEVKHLLHWLDLYDISIVSEEDRTLYDKLTDFIAINTPIKFEEVSDGS